MKRVIIPTIGLWLVFLIMQGYYVLSTLKWHLSFLPLMVFTIALAVCLFIACLMSLWRILVGPRRLEAFSWGTLALLPVLVLYLQFSSYFDFQDSARTEPYEPRLIMAPCGSMVNSVIDGVVRKQQLSKLEGKRVVLFYDFRTSEPQQLVDEMDRFLKSEEEFFGVTMPDKLHWVRNSVFGQPGFAPMGIAVADPDYDAGQSPDPKFPALNHIDRHESSHNVSFSMLKESSPPMMLIEGWAESRTTAWESQARQCLQAREAGCLLSICELVSPLYYYSADERVYYQGAALTHLLIEKYGPKKFVELFSTCSQETFADDVAKIYGMTLEELDDFYMQAIDDYFSFEKATENCSDEEKALIEEYREHYRKQKAVYDELLAHCTINMLMRAISETKPETEKTVFEHDYLLQSRKGGFYRIDTETHTNEEEHYPYDLHAITMIVPHKYYNISRWDCPQEYTHATTKNARYITDQCLQKLHFDAISDMFRPEYVLNSRSLEELLWHPIPGMTVKSVTRKDDGNVVMTLQCKRESQLEQYRLTFAPEQKWALKEIRFTRPEHLFAGFVIKETREYEGESQGFPLLKSCTVEEKNFAIGRQAIRTTNKTFAKMDLTPGPENVFTELSLGVGEIKMVGLPKQSVARLDRKTRLAATWLIISAGLIIVARRRWRRLQRTKIATTTELNVNGAA